MSIKKIFFIIFTLALFAGCGLHEGTINKGQISYLIFTGNSDKVQVYIDDLQPFSVKPSNDSQPDRYEISPGKHKIKIERGGNIVVNRRVLLGNGIIKEIKIP